MPRLPIGHEPGQKNVRAPGTVKGLRAVLGQAAFVVFNVIPAISAPSPPVQLPEVTTIQPIRHLKQSNQGPILVHVHGVVTYYDTVAPNLSVQDKTGGIWVDLRGSKNIF